MQRQKEEVQIHRKSITVSGTEAEAITAAEAVDEATEIKIRLKDVEPQDKVKVKDKDKALILHNGRTVAEAAGIEATTTTEAEEESTCEKQESDGATSIKSIRTGQVNAVRINFQSKTNKECKELRHTKHSIK